MANNTGMVSVTAGATVVANRFVKADGTYATAATDSVYCLLAEGGSSGEHLNGYQQGQSLLCAYTGTAPAKGDYIVVGASGQGVVDNSPAAGDFVQGIAATAGVGGFFRIDLQKWQDGAGT